MILILAYGNSLRRDDGAGFLLADLLETLLSEDGIQTRRIDSHQLAPELALDIAEPGVSAVLFIDTRSVADPSDDLRLHVAKTAPAEMASPSVGHNFDASVLLAYTKFLFKKEPPAWLITVPGKDFEHGEGFSETVRQAVENAGAELAPLIKELAALPQT